MNWEVGHMKNSLLYLLLSLGLYYELIKTPSTRSSEWKGTRRLERNFKSCWIQCVSLIVFPFVFADIV